MAANITILRFRRLVAQRRIIFSDGHMSLFEARMEDSSNLPERKVLWTDASSRNGAVGLGIVWKQDFNEDLQHLVAPGEQEWTERYFVSRRTIDSGTGEKDAVLVGLDVGESLFALGTVGDIVVYTDGGVNDIKNPRVNGGFLNPIGGIATKAAIRAAELAIKGFTVEIKCCRGHSGILGNELADYWARMAIGLDRPGLTTDDWARARQAVRERDERRQLLRHTVAAAAATTTTTTLTAAVIPANTDAASELTPEQQLEADLAELEASVA